MAFLPFYLPKEHRLKLVIVGGGYAGLSALVTVHRYRPGAEIILIDPNDHHVKITHLHETFRRPLSDFLVPFKLLEQRFGFRHVKASVDLEEAKLQEWQRNKVMECAGDLIDFDYLLINVGTGFHRFEKSDRIFDLYDFTQSEGAELLERCTAGQEKPIVTVVGGGATGIQFLFEMAHFARARIEGCQLRLVDAEDAILKQFVPDLGRYAQARLSDFGIEYLPNTFYQSHGTAKVVLQGKEAKESFELPSSAAFLFPGKSADILLETNVFGQVSVEGKTLRNIFAAGDCSHYHGFGSNVMTAQTAVRKGKVAARNILRHSGWLRILEPFVHRDLGYVISLGPSDAVGWIALDGNVIGGYPASMAKEIFEAQYDLLLSGIDTYVI